MSLRLFAALPIPPDTARELKRLQKGVPGARWRPLENFHITLRFFGDVEDRQLEDLDELIKSNPESREESTTLALNPIRTDLLRKRSNLKSELMGLEAGLAEMEETAAAADTAVSEDKT